MTRHYIIKQGDYLTQLAHRFRFDGDAVWNHPDNHGLRRRRPEREILQPGDVLHIPDTSRRGFDLDLNGANRFKATVAAVQLRLTLRDVDGRPYASEPFCVYGPALALRGETDGEGCAAFSVPITLGEVHLTLERAGKVYTVQVGRLDPIEELSGVRQRLVHLDHLVPLRFESNDEDVRLRRALESFQRASGIEATGELDEATRQALRDAHKS